MKGILKKLKTKIIEGLVLVGITVACFSPTILFILIRYLLSPTGFWQNIAVFGLGVWILGGLQLFGFIGWCIVMYGIIFGK